MLTLIDGPCQGSFMVKRAPRYLRAVKDADGSTDVLDQVEDTPKPSEKVYVYRMEGNPGTIHLHGGKSSGWWALASYYHLEALDGESFRDNQAWQEWVLKQK